jgi:hypothetical protein
MSINSDSNSQRRSSTGRSSRRRHTSSDDSSNLSSRFNNELRKLNDSDLSDSDSDTNTTFNSSVSRSVVSGSSRASGRTTGSSESESDNGFGRQGPPGLPGLPGLPGKDAVGGSGKTVIDVSFSPRRRPLYDGPLTPEEVCRFEAHRADELRRHEMRRCEDFLGVGNLEEDLHKRIGWNCKETLPHARIACDVKFNSDCRGDRFLSDVVPFDQDARLLALSNLNNVGCASGACGIPGRLSPGRVVAPVDRLSPLRGKKVEIVDRSDRFILNADRNSHVDPNNLPLTPPLVNTPLVNPPIRRSSPPTCSTGGCALTPAQMNNGPMNNGPMNNGPMNNGPMNNGPMNNGPMNNGPMNAGPMNAGPMNNGPMNNGPMNAGPMNAGPMNNGPMNNGPMNNGPMNNGPMNNGPMNNGPMNAGPVKLLSNCVLLNNYIPPPVNVPVPSSVPVNVSAPLNFSVLSCVDTSSIKAVVINCDESPSFQVNPLTESVLVSNSSKKHNPRGCRVMLPDTGVSNGQRITVNTTCGHKVCVNTKQGFSGKAGASFVNPHGSRTYCYFTGKGWVGL